MSGAGIPIPRPVTAAEILLRLTGAATLAAGSFLVGQGTATLVSTGTGLTYSAGTLTTRPAATQDGIAMAGRAGGTGTYTQTLTTAALTGNRTATFPDATITVAGSASALTPGHLPFVAAGGLLTGSASLSFADPNLTLSAAANGTVQHLVRNTDAVGTSAQSQIQVNNGASATSDLSIGAYGASRSGSQLGTTRANAAFLFSTSASITALIIGHTGSSAPVIIGSNNAAICTFATTDITAAKPIVCTDATASTSTVTGALRVTGGAGIGGALYAASIYSTGTITAGSRVFGTGSASSYSSIKSNNATYSLIELLGSGGGTLATFGAFANTFVIYDSANGHTNTQMCIGVGAPIGAERLRIAGGSAVTSGATDVCLGAGSVDVGTSFRYRGTKLLGAQGAAVADATDATSVIARLNDLLSRLRTHGLIAT
jgi:hypothetical protein